MCVTKFRDPVGVPTLPRGKGNRTIGMLRDTPACLLTALRLTVGNTKGTHQLKRLSCGAPPTRRRRSIYRDGYPPANRADRVLKV